MITTRKTYPFRSFYKGKERIAFYVIEVIGSEPQIVVYSDLLRKADKNIDSIGVRKSELEDDQIRAMELLEKHLPKELAKAIFKYARKDLGCKKGFSLKSYVSWKSQA